VLSLEGAELDADQEDLLRVAKLVRVATISSTGDPLTVPTRFYFDGKAVYFASPERSPHVINLRGNRRVCLLVDSDQGGDLRGVIIQGLAQFVKGKGERRGVLEGLAKKYGEACEGTVVKVVPVRVMDLKALE
jgi:nitroimidazol reductase NimA-like FMN-containing flavoprotein (pyridoxamine 5'-phosphate oxidase superfamily)